MGFWIGFALYVAGGIALVPRFAKETYAVLRDKNSRYDTETESKSEAMMFAWAKSLIWPIFAIMSYALWHLNADDRRKEAEEKAEKDLAQAERIVALHKAKQQIVSSQETNQWLQTFNQFDRDAKKS